MNTKLFEVLKTKCKSFGLTKKALEELTELGSSELTDESTDEEIAAKADLLVPYAKAMQGEITRKTRKSSTKKQSEDEGDGEDESDTDMPAWFKTYQQSNDARIAALEQENTTLKAEKAATERATTIADKAKKLGIPEFMAKRLHIADDADIDAELTNFKQELVNNSLMPKGQAHEAGKVDLTQAKEDAKTWAAGLPD
ncbi:hypothetical protein [Bacteroides xylanisolvens]|uniref:hypothetical protein n=1 Tax=Bacteroides xylanisolvens TaxID=371601 RepID=UPI001CDD608E|nr:hypothetical protein [Bacteroides xylanisolvens]MCA4468118.1 hypothetical protein [Bacteroides xylanisolvens]MCA4472560.1 hypothetical protein [Bacteroides xylanisolvens]MCA4481710.1 hypothetical protein [Bacteroides xylanisolvens]MCA4521535.1 hypothetical protein [Bacteroides xylanisolvens]MCA4558099.1 hypothetical protein [Bacteroides xylanisolvens]